MRPTYRVKHMKWALKKINKLKSVLKYFLDFT